MDAITPRDALPKLETRLLPALAEAIAEWFPELGGRAMAVSDSSITKENIPTLPLAVTAFVRSVGEQSEKSRQSQFEVTDHIIVEFWLPSEKYRRANGSEAPFWSYYNYEAIRDKLLTHMATWTAPRNARIAYRTLNIEADHLAVTLTFGFIACINWKACIDYPPDMIIDHIGFNMCVPEPDCCVPEDCLDPDPCDPCPPDPPTGGIQPPPVVPTHPIFYPEEELEPTHPIVIPPEEEDLEEAPADGKFYVRQNGQWVVFPSVKANQVSVPDPRGTNNAAWTMMGLGLVVTPGWPRAVVICDGQISNAGNNGETDIQLVYGSTLPPPNNGDPMPANAIVLGDEIRYMNKSGGGFVPFSQTGLIIGLTTGQQIWIGLAMKTIGGAGSVQDISILAHGLM